MTTENTTPASLLPTNHESRLKTFYHFLSFSLESSNIDCLKLAHKQWQKLKASHIQTIPIIDAVFSIYDGSSDTLEEFFQECERQASRIKNAPSMREYTTLPEKCF